MIFKKLLRLLTTPDIFFDSIQGEGSLEPLKFLLFVSIILAIFTPLVNYLGLPSTDTSASFQAQILAWRLTEAYLLPYLGVWAYGVESLLIVGFALLMAVVSSGLIYGLYRLAGGKGRYLNAWKAICYGVGPCILLGWLPYWSLFVAAWSLILQFYYGPKILYKLPEGRAIWILAFFVGAAILEITVRGTTVGFGLR